jgi:hypothetical protein
VKVLGVGAVRRWLYLIAKALGVGPARRCLVAVVGSDAFSGDVKPPPPPPGLDIRWSVDHLGTYGPVLSCQTFHVTASRGPNSGGVYPVLEAPGCSYWEPGRAPNWVTRLGYNWHPSVPWGYKTPTRILVYGCDFLSLTHTLA